MFDELHLDTLEQIVAASAESVRPPERLTVWQAAANYRILRNPGSYVGPYNNQITPYMIEPQEVLTSLEYTGMVIVAPARTGKSDLFFNWLNHTAICDPADMMLIHMTQATARDWSQGDLAKEFRNSKELGKRLTPGRQNDNVHDKRFLSGMRLLIKWPTITELSGKTIRFLWAMDYDRMPQDIDGEGNAFDLMRKRATTFKRFGMAVAESSPGFLVNNPKWIASSPHEAPPTDGILKIYNRGDRRRWYWKCPQCEETFQPKFPLLFYPDCADSIESAEQAVLICPHNGCIITPNMKDELNLAGRWIKDGQRWLADGSIVGTARRSDIASFWMFGPAAAFQDWKSLVLNHLNALADYEATGSEESLKTTTNVDQGDAYTPKAIQSERLPEELKDRAQDWGGTAAEPVVPDGVLYLVATIDVQAGGRPAFVVQVSGFGHGGDLWYVDMFKIRKSNRLDDDGERHLIDPAAYPEDWQLIVEQVIEKTYPLNDGSGRRMRIKFAGCDSGGREGVTKNAYEFWRWLKKQPEGHHKRFRLLKGESSRNPKPRIRETFPDTARKDRHSGARGDVPVIIIDANLMKDQVSAMLGRTDPGGGMVNFPIWAENWLYTQLTAEVRTEKGWENPRRVRNEAFDLTYYGVALTLYRTIRGEHINWEKPPIWAREWDNNELVFHPDGPQEDKADGQTKETLKNLGRDLA